MVPSRSRFLALCSVLALSTGVARAEPARLVRDLRTSAVNGASFPRGFVVWNGRAYFAASDHRHGRELWTTDGTRRGTRLVRDVRPGPRSAPDVPHSLAPGEGVVWLVHDDGASGPELWASDGTADGTRLVSDLCPGPCSGFPSRLFPWRDAVFFAYRDDVHGNELWFSDGTREGTRLVRDICPGLCSGLPAVGPFSDLRVAELGGIVLFAASDGERRALWRSDGTAEGTARLTDANVSGDWAALGGELFFDAYGELWKTDGTPEGTAWVTDLDSRGIAVPIYAVGDELLLVSQAGSYHLWRSDGTAAGTVHFASLPVEVELVLPPTPLATEGGFRALFLTGSQLIVDSGDQLWTTDGTGAGTRPLADLDFADPSQAVVGGRLVFRAGGEPWVSDGTPEGTHRLTEGWPGEAGTGPTAFTTLDPSHVLFSAATGRGQELWITDGTAAGTRQLKDIDGPDRSSYPTALTVFDERLFFVAATADEGGGLWASDGTEDGTAPVAADLRVDEVVAATDHLYFAGGDAGSPRKPWVSDGTAEGTVRLSEIEIGEPVFTGAPSAYELVTVGDTLFFAERGNRRGQRLWASDGTPAGTRVVRDLHPRWLDPCFEIVYPPHVRPPCTSLNYPRELTPAGDRLYFVGNDGGHGAELWKSDGSRAGTAMVADIVHGRSSSDPANLTVAGTRLFFTAAGYDGRRRLRVSDGTAAGTRAVAGLGDAEARELTALGDRLFFIGSRSSGDSLYLSKAPSYRAVLVRKLEAGGEPGFARELTVVGGRLFFAVLTAATGEELWTSDGTAAGTRLVAEIVPGPRGSYPQSLADVDGRLFFAADDGAKGLELWTSDGTAAGTCRVKNVGPGPLPSSPAEMTALGDRVFFAADGGAVGRELWSLPLSVRCRRR